MKKIDKGKVCKRMVIACSGGKHLAKSIARKINACYCTLETEIFPDTELRVRLPKEVKNWDVYFLQSFYKDRNDVNDKLIEVLFAAKTAKELGAKNIYLISPYLGYLREDIRFKKGEAVSARILADLFKIFKRVYVVEPHLHRFEKFKQFFPNAEKVTLADELALYIKKNIGECLLIGPDIESEKWVVPVAKELGLKYLILEKYRFSSRKVKVVGKKIAADKVVMIDDIISTGHTLLEASKLVKTKRLYFIASHGLFSEGALSKLCKKGKVIVSNTVPSSVSKIDCSSALARAIGK